MAIDDGNDEGTPLDPTSFQRLNDVRKEVWRGGVVGLVGGLVLGAAGFELSRSVPSLRRYHSPNAFFASVLCSGAFFSFILSINRGQRSVVLVGDVFTKGANPLATYETKRVETIVADSTKKRS